MVAADGGRCDCGVTCCGGGGGGGDCGRYVGKNLCAAEAGSGVKEFVIGADVVGSDAGVTWTG
jgi:hypothetical protein